MDTLDMTPREETHDPQVTARHLNESSEIDKSDSDTRLYWYEGVYAQLELAA